MKNICQKNPRTLKKRLPRRQNPKQSALILANPLKKQMETEQISDDADCKCMLQIDEPIKKSNRPEDEVVIYNEVEFELKEIISNGNQVLIGRSKAYKI